MKLCSMKLCSIKFCRMACWACFLCLLSFERGHAHPSLGRWVQQTVRQLLNCFIRSTQGSLKTCWIIDDLIRWSRFNGTKSNGNSYLKNQNLLAPLLPQLRDSTVWTTPLTSKEVVIFLIFKMKTNQHQNHHQWLKWCQDVKTRMTIRLLSQISAATEIISLI